MFERLRAALNAALDRATPPADLRDLARRMREAVIESAAAVAGLRDAIGHTERELAVERRQLADADRRGRLAGEIQDRETVQVAERFAAKHRERVRVLEHKLAAQREELALAERERSEMQAQLAKVEHDRPATEAERSAARAWRELREAGDPLQRDLDQSMSQAAVERQLADLKKRMKKE